MNPIAPVEQTNPRDDGLEWLREMQREISSEFGHDESKIGAAIRKREIQVKHRLVRCQPRLVPMLKMSAQD
ncbi:MAG: hypothetical protein WCP35_05530 [Verrucomicrobiota bacterium]